MPLDYAEADLREKTRKMLGLGDIAAIGILKKSVDARDKSNIFFVLTLEIGSRERSRRVQPEPEKPEQNTPGIAQYPAYPFKDRPVIAGSGPAGIFCALTLCRAGGRPIILERGPRLERRVKDVAAFWQTGLLNESSNVQFGEGGAGTFSDGKLTTGTHDPRNRLILEEFVRAGAPDEILYLSKPHIGTDKLRGVLTRLRGEIEALGGEYIFDAKLAGIAVSGGKARAALAERAGGGCEIATEHIVLAVGHSSRDTFEALRGLGVSMAPKPFAVGVRIEHRQEWINAAQYGKFAACTALGAADYKLSARLGSGRGVFTFCMCPGGVVAASASERGGVVTNGMSRHARSGENANSAVLVSVAAEDFYRGNPLDGIYWQRELEERAFGAGIKAGGRGYFAPAQKLGDFLAGKPTEGFSGGVNAVTPSYAPGVAGADLGSVLPCFVADALKEGIMLLGKKMPGFARPDAVMTAVESRSSSPVRICRDAGYRASVAGIYPCGEGAGYAGGIMSSAVDGMKCAEALLAQNE